MARAAPGACAPGAGWAWRATPFAPLLLRERAARGKEDRARMAERLGMPARRVPTAG